MPGHCVFCGTETILYQGRTPICVDCSKIIDAGQIPKKTVQKERDDSNCPEARAQGNK